MGPKSSAASLHPLGRKKKKKTQVGRLRIRPVSNDSRLCRPVMFVLFNAGSDKARTPAFKKIKRGPSRGVSQQTGHKKHKRRKRTLRRKRTAAALTALAYEKKGERKGPPHRSRNSSNTGGMSAKNPAEEITTGWTPDVDLCGPQGKGNREEKNTLTSPSQTASSCLQGFLSEKGLSGKSSTALMGHRATTHVRTHRKPTKKTRRPQTNLHKRPTKGPAMGKGNLSKKAPNNNKKHRGPQPECQGPRRQVKFGRSRRPLPTRRTP